MKKKQPFTTSNEGRVSVKVFHRSDGTIHQILVTFLGEKKGR